MGASFKRMVLAANEGDSLAPGVIRAAGRAAAIGVGALLALRVLAAISAHSVWLDEWFTLSLAFWPSAGTFAWVKTIFASGDPHFPPIYLWTRAVSGPLGAGNWSVEWATRLPLALAVLLALAVAIRWALDPPRFVMGEALALGLVGILLSGEDWRLHASEARPYGLMAVLGVAMIVALLSRRPVGAVACGLVLVLLHPFGLLVGWAPSITLLGAAALGRAEALGAGPRRVRWIGFATALAAGLWIWWTLQRFVLRNSNGFGFRGTGGDVFQVLAGLDRRAVAAAVLATIALGLVLLLDDRRRRLAGREAGPGLLSLVAHLVLLLTLGLGVGALVVLKPAISTAMARYIAWANPVLYLLVASSAVIVLERAMEAIPGPRARSRVRAAVASAAMAAAGVWSVALARSVPLGPPWGDGLREAAAYLNAVAGPDSAVTHDTYEMLRYSPPFGEGHRCTAAGQIVPYLSPEVRSRMPCQGKDERVRFPDMVARVYLIREPVRVPLGRTLELGGFTPGPVLTFGNAVVEQYDRSLR